MHLYELSKRETYFGALHCFTAFLTQALNLHTIQAKQGTISDMPVKTCLQTMQVCITSLRALRAIDMFSGFSHIKRRYVAYCGRRAINCLCHTLLWLLIEATSRSLPKSQTIRLMLHTHDHEPSEKQANAGHRSECSISFFKWFWTSRSGISQHMPAIHGTKTACPSTQLIKKQHWQHPPKTSWTWLLAWLMSRKDSKPWKWPSPYALCRPTYCYIKFTLCICAILTSERSN